MFCQKETKWQDVNLRCSKRLVFRHTTSPRCFSAGYVDYAKKWFPKFNLYFDITGQQFPLVIVFFADYALEELLKVCLWIDAVEPATLRKRKDEGCIFSSTLTSYFLSVFQVQFYWFHSLFTEIVWDLQPAVLDEVLKWLS